MINTHKVEIAVGKLLAWKVAEFMVVKPNNGICEIQKSSHAIRREFQVDLFESNYYQLYK